MMIIMMTMMMMMMMVMMMMMMMAIVMVQRCVMMMMVYCCHDHHHRPPTPWRSIRPSGINNWLPSNTILGHLLQFFQAVAQPPTAISASISLLQVYPGLPRLRFSDGFHVRAC